MNDRPRLLLVGGAGGLVGRALLEEFLPGWAIRSVHRTPNAEEARAGVEWHRGDVGGEVDWERELAGVDCVLNVAWYRWETPARFDRLARGLERLIDAAERASVPRFLHISVPAAPPRLESQLPYLFRKREVDRHLSSSGLSYRIVRPTMLYGRGDRLLGVMLRIMRRYHRFPMFGDGDYHVSPLAASDLARLLRIEARGSATGAVDVGGPERLRYRELTDRMFAALGRPARYLRMSRSGAIRLSAILVALGSKLLYPYEVEWLMSDMLGLPPYGALDRPLSPVGPYLEAEARRLGVRGGKEQV